MLGSPFSLTSPTAAPAPAHAPTHAHTTLTQACAEASGVYPPAADLCRAALATDQSRTPPSSGYCVNAAGPDTDVYVRGGFCNSNMTSLPASLGGGRTSALRNVTKASDVRGYNPIGVIRTPFGASGPGKHASHFLSPSGTSATPTPGVVYTVRGADAMVTVANGEGVVVTIADALGSLFYEHAVTAGSALPPTALPVGWTISFGVFTAPPRVLVGGS